MIKAPFNFVPLSDKVFFPDWASAISHDIPFEDGVSGSIEMMITAQSPIFVRNGHTHGDADAKNENYMSFSNDADGRYFIPGTSIKGTIRNVLEIMSFGKMCMVNNKRYSIRDLKLPEYMSYFQNNSIHCGWMTLRNEKNIIITDCGEPYRISHKTIDSIYNTDLVDTFETEANFKKNSDKYRSAIYKIKKFENKNKTSTFLEIKSTDPNPVDKRKFVIVSPTNDGIKGTIVFTGQPGIRKPGFKRADGTKLKGTGKFYEFVFPEQEITSYTLPVGENSLYEDFCFVYKDSPEWDYWREILESNGRVPVFFSTKDGQIVHFGLSYLYKLPYIKKICDYLYDCHKSKDKDLPECIFGTADDSGLKGRVSFGHAFCVNEKEYYDTLYPYMGSPRPTYYPMYLKQEGSDGLVKTQKNGKTTKVLYSTMLSQSAKLRGFKRYPVQKKYVEDFEVPKDQESNTNPFNPLAEGSEFKCTVRFHNLKRIELAALVSAIQLGAGSYHSIGFAKPFGYGKCSIEITNIHGCDISVEDLKKEFREFMNSKIDKYSSSEQIKEFNAMSREQNLRAGAQLSYMSLPDFPDCKKNGEYLQPYSEYIEKAKTENVVVSKEDVATVSYSDKSKAYIGDDKSKLYPIEFSGIKASFKPGEKINVTLRIKDGKIKGIVFVSKIG